MRGTKFANTGNAQEDAMSNYQNDNNIIYLFPDSDASSSPNKYDELLKNNSDDDNKSDNEFDKMPRYLNIESGDENNYSGQSSYENNYSGQYDEENNSYANSSYANSSYTNSSYANSSYTNSSYANSNYNLKNYLDEILKTDMAIEVLCPEIKHKERENNVFFGDNSKLSRTAEIVSCAP